MNKVYFHSTFFMEYHSNMIQFMLVSLISYTLIFSATKEIYKLKIFKTFPVNLRLWVCDSRTVYSGVRDILNFQGKHITNNQCGGCSQLWHEIELHSFDDIYFSKAVFLADAVIKKQVSTKVSLEWEMRVRVANLIPKFEKLCSIQQAHMHTFH